MGSCTHLAQPAAHHDGETLRVTISPAAAPQSFRYPLVSASPTEAKARHSKPLCKSLCKPSLIFPLPRGRFSRRLSDTGDTLCPSADFVVNALPVPWKRKGTHEAAREAFPFPSIPPSCAQIRRQSAQPLVDEDVKRLLTAGGSPSLLSLHP